MKKITHLKSLSFLIACFCVVSFGFGQSDIIISQYIETSSGTTPKGIEIFNISGSDITFSVANNLQIYQGTNGMACSNLSGTNITSGTLLANEVWVIGTTDLTTYANTNGTNLSGTVDYSFAFNGNDALQLYLGGVLQDEFGTCGNNPGGSWTGSGVDTRNNNLQILDGLCDGDINGWIDPSERFTQIADGLTMTGFGNAPLTCASCFGLTTTWNGATWDNGVPNITTPAVINGSYNTATANITACSLTVNNSTLTVNDNTYIEIENDITVNGGSIDVQPYGTIVQNNDSGVVTNNGSMTVDKWTAPMNAWYEYTYWSSPVSGETIGGAITDSHPSRRFMFNGQNFLDHCAETGNNNTLVCDDGFGNGVQDDIDDNGNDWQSVSGATIMQAGIGYATTLTSFAYDIAPGSSNKQFRFTFDGDFNNGVITVPIYRNDSELSDYNWNFIGNPYPSAIDADLFLSANSNVSTDVVTAKSINGAIFLWSQNTPPSSTANGSQQFNFTSDDFAIINAVGTAVGGDNIMPTRFIPSGQGFFVSMDNAAPASLVSGDVYTTNIVFNNSMRVANTTANSQFFKNSNTKKSSDSAVNKLWVDLTSDNGVFNQILVGYVSGATNDDDGISYDTVKFPTKGAALYSTIEGSNKKFTIQGKAKNSLDSDETIKLGFKTTIDVPTLYKLSIAQLQGDFLTNNMVYLKDNLLNKLHNLSTSDYTFTSEIGEFNDRFEIVFNANALSVEDISSNKNNLDIIELDNDLVQFKISNNLNIKTVSIFDPLGRQLYSFKGQKSSETYKLSGLNSSIYIAKVELSNGTIITKKAIKK